MNIEALNESFKVAVNEAIRLYPEGTNRYQIFTPFQFDDGDHFVIVLKKVSGNWIITDEGHTYMHMSYHMNLASLETGHRNTIIENALRKHNIVEQKGQIFSHIDEFANAGNIFYNFVQCLIGISNVSYLTRERKRDVAFMEEFKLFVKETIPENKIQFEHHPVLVEQAGKYPIDCRVNSMKKPLHLYGIGDDVKCRDTTINILHYKNLETPFDVCGIFKNRRRIGQRVYSRFIDVCPVRFDNLAEDREEIVTYLTKHIG